jgi:hypothetical protein
MRHVILNLTDFKFEIIPIARNKYDAKVYCKGRDPIETNKYFWDRDTAEGWAVQTIHAMIEESEGAKVYTWDPYSLKWKGTAK